GRELLIEDHGAGARAVHLALDLVELAAADERRGVRLLPRLEDPRDRLGPGAVRERRELVEITLLDPAPDADEDRLLGDPRAPGRGERRLERRRLVDAALSGAVR